jgi:2,4-diaminopentanoate dehydrogenase
MAKIRVVQWGAGYTGKFALRYILSHPDCELVGLQCGTDSSAGKDAGSLAGVGNTGVLATRDGDALLDLKPDVVSLMAFNRHEDPSLIMDTPGSWVSDMLRMLERGVNVVSPMIQASHWRHLAQGQAFKTRVEEACAKGKSTVHFSGFDPGFATDAAATALSSVVGEVRQIRTWEFIDVSSYTAVETLQMMGFGTVPAPMPPGAEQPFRVGWGGALHLLADAFGVTIEDTTLDFDAYVSPISFTTAGGLTVEAGTLGAISWSLNGIVNGKPFIKLHHVTRASADMAPDWPNIGTDGGYRVELDSFPPFRGDFPMGLPGGTGSSFTDAMSMTAARCINAIPAVVKAAPGYKTFLDLPVFGARGAFL